MELKSNFGESRRITSWTRRRPRFDARASGKWLAVLALAVAGWPILLPLTLHAAPKTVIIKMLDSPTEFDPAQVTINVGDTVRWKNVGNTLHDATNNSSLAINQAQVSNPAGAKVFDSGFLNPGQSFDQKFTSSGTYKYVCVPHETSGMVGTIVVK